MVLKCRVSEPALPTYVRRPKGHFASAISRVFTVHFLFSSQMYVPWKSHLKCENPRWLIRTCSSVARRSTQRHVTADSGLVPGAWCTWGARLRFYNWHRGSLHCKQLPVVKGNKKRLVCVCVCSQFAQSSLHVFCNIHSNLCGSWKKLEYDQYIWYMFGIWSTCLSIINISTYINI